MGMVWFGGQSKRMSFEDVKAVQIRQGASAQSTWVQEMQQGSNQSIIISEFLNDETTKEQLAQADVPGVMVSDDMVAMVLAMVAEDKKVSYILSELFAQEGHEFFFRSAEIYLRGETEELSFYNIMSRARHRKEIVLGYQHAFEDHPIMNPPDKAAIKTWHAHDGFIVLAEV
jgi:DNA-binding LacI/PurR family transcriptional regulator